MKRIAAALSCVLVTGVVFAGSPSRVLIPTLYNGPGALGSRWFCGVLVDNREPTPFKSPGVSFKALCTIPEGCTTDQVDSGGWGQLWDPLPVNGLLLYLPSENAHIAFMARLAASPRSPISGGTELPVVREREFTSGPIELPFVPLRSFSSDGLRTTLRIYAPDAQAGTFVRVQLGGSPEAAPSFATTVALNAPLQPGTVPIYPGFAQLTLQDAFPAAALSYDTWNVFVIPIPFDSTSTPRIWAFVSITNNASQEVTIQRPQ
jgi:hypothetical protein